MEGYLALIKEQREENDKLEIEIKRLNNIINSFEKYINGKIENCYNNGCYADEWDLINEFNSKLKELKGSDK